MKPLISLSIFTFVQYLRLTHAHSSPHINVFGLSVPAQATPEFTRRDESTLLDPRQASGSGQKCGVQNGGTSCPQGFCCSEDGECGTGRAYCDAPYCQYKYGPACDDNATPVGTDTSSVPRPVLGSIEYGGGGIWNCTKPGYVALTYDDGPYIYTGELLDILAKRKVPATFFLTGNNYGKHGMDNESTPYPGLIRRMITDGHQVGSHTWSHQDLDKLSTEDRTWEMTKNEMAFRNIMGFWPTYMRPPYDSCKADSGCRSDMSTLGYHIVEYTVDTYDFDNRTPQTYPLSQSNVSAAFEGSDSAKDDYIVYSHDTHPQTVRNLTEYMIDTIGGLGYKFATIGDCLNDPKKNWYRDPSTGKATDAVIKHSSSSSSGSSSSEPSSGSGTVTSTVTETVKAASSTGTSCAALSISHGGWSVVPMLLALGYLMTR
ncbi:hypothetical protein LTR70_006526 [Exophiala xenobiotica]|uniref:Chitin deacetylase n=1 Tax=Lithohypha guttulata TaxID=1690604 RepID=A0ABR0K7F3_9EURO|nr:hypothetical protein LTR24_006033 [Lithohypha guttulata]KAK5315884.1 hypothetical protein LTR70_006526 [Exophiala xenobiotica]